MDIDPLFLTYVGSSSSTQQLSPSLDQVLESLTSLHLGVSPSPTMLISPLVSSLSTLPTNLNITSFVTMALLPTGDYLN